MIDYIYFENMFWTITCSIPALCPDDQPDYVLFTVLRHSTNEMKLSIHTLIKWEEFLNKSLYGLQTCGQTNEDLKLWLSTKEIACIFSVLILWGPMEWFLIYYYWNFFGDQLMHYLIYCIKADEKCKYIKFFFTEIIVLC